MKKLSLRSRIYLLMGALLLIGAGGGAVMVWYTLKMEHVISEIFDGHAAALREAEGLEAELAHQKGFVSYYFIDGDPRWLEQLAERRSAFRARLNRVHGLALTGEEQEILGRVEVEYAAYVRDKDQVIAFYKDGRMREGSELHELTRGHYTRLEELVDRFRALHRARIAAAIDKSHRRAGRYRLFAAAASGLTVIIILALTATLILQVLEPVRRLAASAAGGEKTGRPPDEVADLTGRVRHLIEDHDQARDELEKSRERLFMSEKMAVVGKLAADVAHSIRNPMTSIKMRLFSLERGLELSPNQKEDLEVVSEEMRRLDNIVRNFLEFSRPPKLKKQKVDANETIDMALQLLQHRIEMSGVAVLRKTGPVPPIEADPELLKEVLVNFIVNACEAMDGGGTLSVSVSEAAAEGQGRVVMVTVQDSGPGVPESLRESVFEPFFTTKEDGTGLGLSIAARIVEEHGGRLSLRSRPGEGAAFIVTLPVMEDR